MRALRELVLNDPAARPQPITVVPAAAALAVPAAKFGRRPQPTAGVVTAAPQGQAQAGKSAPSRAVQAHPRLTPG
jgi:hypothetical protein